MSLRKGSLEDYFNSIAGAASAGCKVIPGFKSRCYQDKVEPNTRAKLVLYANPKDAPKKA